MDNTQLISAIATLNNPNASIEERVAAASVLSSVTKAIKTVEREQATKLGFRLADSGSVGLCNLPAYKMVDGLEWRQYLKDGRAAVRKFPLSATPRQWLQVIKYVASGDASAFLRANYPDECADTLDRLGL